MISDITGVENQLNERSFVQQLLSEQTVRTTGGSMKNVDERVSE